MFEVNEWKPKGGWWKYHRRQELKEKIFAYCGLILLLLGYCFVGYIERGM